MKPVMRRIVLCGLLALVPSVSQGADSQSKTPSSTGDGGNITLQKKPGGGLTLQEVVAQVLLKNPDLEVYSWEVRAREARALQEGLLNNPQLSISPQDFWGSGKLAGFDSMENTAMLSQVIELGGKRMKRQRAAHLDRDLAQWDYETRRMEVLTRVSQDFTDVLAGQERVKLHEELVGLSQKALETVQARVTAGKVSPIDEVKAGVALATHQVNLDQARSTLAGAKQRLATSWGSTEVTFDHVQGNLFATVPVTPLQNLKDDLSRNPDLARWATEVIHRQAVVTREESKAVPNITLGAGSRYIQEVKDYAWQVNITVPLPIFDRNQGGIAEARHRLSKADAEKRSVELQLQRALSIQYANLVNAYKRVENLKTKILPGAQTAFEAVNEGYRYGKFGYLEVLDSQRTWFDARSQFLDALAEYHKAVADVERLTGQAISVPPKPRPLPYEREREQQR